MNADQMKNLLWIGISIAAFLVLGALVYQNFMTVQEQPNIDKPAIGDVIEQTDLQDYLQPHTSQSDYRDIDLKLPLADELQNSLSEIAPEILTATKSIQNSSFSY